MRLKGYFFILTFFLIILGGVILYFGGWIYRPLLYGSEILIAFLLIYLILFYRKIIKPLDTIGSGMELLREQDFSSRLSLVGQYEADRVVNVFNRMMEQLKNERLRLREQNRAVAGVRTRSGVRAGRARVCACKKYGAERCSRLYSVRGVAKAARLVYAQS